MIILYVIIIILFKERGIEMNSIIEMIKENMDKGLRIPLFAFFSILIVLIVFKFIKKEGIAKYIFGFILLSISLISFIVSITNLTNPITLITLEIFVVSLSSGVISLCMAWLLDIFFIKGKK